LQVAVQAVAGQAAAVVLVALEQPLDFQSAQVLRSP
jgi:hypothetical protein